MLPRESRALSFLTTESLATGISRVLRAGEEGRRLLTVLRRTANPYASSLPSEIVTCLLTDGTELRLLCKYDVVFENASGGHRGGIEYEAMVHGHVLAPGRATAPTCYGTFTDSAEGSTCLVVEYVDAALRLDETSDGYAIERVASWLAGFHRENEARLPVLLQRGVLRRYDADYYMNWAERAVAMAGAVGRAYSWLPALRDGFAGLIHILLSSHTTVVHGEFYPHNILLNTRGVFPVDWETAAIAAGDIDVAAVVEGWSDEAARDFELVYRRARWADASGTWQQEALDAARLYWLFRWLGDRPEWTGDERSAARFQSLMRIGRRMGII